MTKFRKTKNGCFEFIKIEGNKLTSVYRSDNSFRLLITRNREIISDAVTRAEAQATEEEFDSAMHACLTEMDLMPVPLSERKN